MNSLLPGKRIPSLLLGCCLLLVSGKLFSQSTLILRSAEEIIDLNPYVRIAEEPSEKLRLNDAIQWDGYVPFDSSQKLTPNKAYWGIVSLQNGLPYDVDLVFSPDWGTAIEHNGDVDVYLIYADSTLAKKSGRFIPASQKDVPKGPDNYVSLALAAGQQVEVFFRIEKINHVAPVCNVKLVERNRWEILSQGKRYIFEGIVQGMLWMMILYSFIIFLGTRERSYLIYTLFLLSSSIYFLYLSGILLEVFLYEVPKLNTFVRIIVSNLVPWAFFQISRSFVDTATLIPKWDKAGSYLLKGIIIWMCVEFIINLIWFHEPILNLMVNSAFMLEGLFLLAIIIRYFFTPYTIARIFIYGSICMVLAAFVGVGADVFFNIQSLLPIVEGAFIAQVLTFALGLAYRLRMGEREKLEAQKLLNERLIHTDQLKDTFLANTSHELRTPLTGILGLSENLYERMDTISSEHAQKDLRMIVTSARRLTSLVNDILDFSKLKTHDLTIEKKAVDVHSLVDVVLHTNRPLISGKEISLENAIPEDLPLVLGDENRLQQVFYNLIGNSIKFTEKGYIQVSAEVKEGVTQLRIADTGTGIPEHKREAIFQEFEQADGSIQREFAGTGLGLSISKRLVELHGGEIWVESTVGKGSTFFITLPLAPKGMQAETEKTLTPLVQIESNGHAAPTITVSGRKDGVRILIVDDEVINHHVLKNHLGEGSFEKVSAMNGEEALQLIEEEEPFDLVLLDLMMPRMSGYEVCEEIRKKYLPSELPVIMITAKNQVSDLVYGYAKGANDYLAKPFSRDEFLARMKTQLHLHNINTITSRFMPREFINSLGLTSMLDLKLGDHAAREVTVFFCDIRGYTTLSETMTPTENFKFVNAFAGRLGPVIKENYGFVHQYLGDCIMAIFVRSSEDCLKASIEMQKVLRDYNLARVAQKRIPLRVGMGFHTGGLVMGIIGDSFRTEAATISDTVNTASRMEGLTKFFGARILLSEDSLSEIRENGQSDSYQVRYMGKVQVKGRKEAIGVYECIDGDEPTQLALKKASIAEFEEALEAYFEQDFVKAMTSFKKIVKHNPHDKAAYHYLAKSSKYVVDGVAEDWTGIESMKTK